MKRSSSRRKTVSARIYRNGLQVFLKETILLPLLPVFLTSQRRIYLKATISRQIWNVTWHKKIIIPQEEGTNREMDREMDRETVREAAEIPVEIKVLLSNSI